MDIHQQVQAERRRRSLSYFIKDTFKTVDPGAEYLHNWHIDLMSEYLMACYMGQIKNLIINIPPRFLKSIEVTVAFPAWVLGQDPSEQFVASSYSDKLSTKHSVDCRLVMESDWYRYTFPDTQMAKDQNEKTKFQTTKRGHRIATSVGGTVIGEGGNYLITDDPMNPKASVSETERKSINDWFDQSWSTRKNNPKTAVEIIVMQRLHVDDTTGHALKEDNWEHLVIPQEAPEKQIIIFPLSKQKITRKKGELIHPERFGKAEVKAAKRRLGTYGYAGQQQQEPTPMGGGLIKIDWFPRFRAEAVEYDEVVMSLDTAQKAREVNDPSVCHIFKRKGSVWHWTKTWKDRVRYPQLKKMTKSLAESCSPDAILIEDKSSGSSLIQELHDDTDLPVIAIEPESDKITRMNTQTPSLEAGIVALPDIDYIPAPWLADVETYLMHFPSPGAWDEIDALSQFLKWLRKREGVDDTIVPFSMSKGSSFRGK